MEKEQGELWIRDYSIVIDYLIAALQRGGGLLEIGRGISSWEFGSVLSRVIHVLFMDF